MAKLGRADTLGEVIAHHLEERLADVHTAVPAKVTAYDAAKQQASVQVAVKTRDELEDGTEVARSIAEIHGVPVVFPGAGAYAITFPVAAGDTVLLVFAERSVDRWLAGTGDEVDPADVRTFHVTDAIAIPGLRPFGAPLSNVPTDAVCIKGPVKLGAHDATSFAAKADKVTAALNLISTTVGGLVGSPTGIPLLDTNVAATLVKVK